MAMVVTEPCFGCKHRQCLSVCPTDSFREGESMLYIDPESCIDCGACVEACPVHAIFYEEDVPEAWRGYIDLNQEMAAVCPPVTPATAGS